VQYRGESDPDIPYNPQARNERASLRKQVFRIGDNQAKRAAARACGLPDGDLRDPVTGQLVYARSHGGSDGCLSVSQRKQAFEDPLLVVAHRRAEATPYDYWRDGGPTTGRNDAAFDGAR